MTQLSTECKTKSKHKENVTLKNNKTGNVSINPPIANLTKFQKGVYYSGIKIFNNLPHDINPLNPELTPICYLLALLGAHYFLHVSRIRVKSLTFRLLMSFIYGSPILDVSRSHTTTQHSR